MTNSDAGITREFLGINWFSKKDEILSLNNIVNEKIKVFVSDSKKNGSELPPEVAYVLAGHYVVYKRRWTWIPLILMIFSLYLVLLNLKSPITIILAAFFSYMWYDFFSGTLHITLDNPSFISLPLLGEPCLEFQWHHHIPLDICSKSFLEVCGDLNVAICLVALVYWVPYIGLGLTSSTALTLIGSKILMAYFGQLCHCMSHTPKHRRPKWVCTLQDAGLMISPVAHNKHHKSYDGSFCIGSGICNPLFEWILKNISSNKWFWLVFFVSSLVFDVPIFNYIMTNCLGL